VSCSFCGQIWSPVAVLLRGVSSRCDSTQIGQVPLMAGNILLKTVLKFAYPTICTGDSLPPPAKV
jgi:hypothetical protein